MKLFWLMVIVSARCSGSDEIPLDRAEQSSTYGVARAAKAIDNDLETNAYTVGTEATWLRVYFTSSFAVGKVVIEKGKSYAQSGVYTVSVYAGETGTVCGTYTDKPVG